MTGIKSKVPPQRTNYYALHNNNVIGNCTDRWRSTWKDGHDTGYEEEEEGRGGDGLKGVEGKKSCFMVHHKLKSIHFPCGDQSLLFMQTIVSVLCWWLLVDWLDCIICLWYSSINVLEYFFISIKQILDGALHC